MKLSIPESKATIKAVLMLRNLLENGGPQPLARPWFPGERVHRAAEVDLVVRKIKNGLGTHFRECRRGSRCANPFHTHDLVLDKHEMYTMVDGLDIAHILLTSAVNKNGLKDKDRYDMLRHVRAVLFKCGSSLVGAET